MRDSEQVPPPFPSGWDILDDARRIGAAYAAREWWRKGAAIEPASLYLTERTWHVSDVERQATWVAEPYPSVARRMAYVLDRATNLNRDGGNAGKNADRTARIAPRSTGHPTAYIRTRGRLVQIVRDGPNGEQVSEDEPDRDGMQAEIAWDCRHPAPPFPGAEWETLADSGATWNQCYHAIEMWQAMREPPKLASPQLHDPDRTILTTLPAIIEESDLGQTRSRGDREEITGFSERSRRNLRRKVGAIRKGEQPLFLTLTFHETDPDPDEAKYLLKRFLQKIDRSERVNADEGRSLAAIWRMEPQKRGTPHFHLMIYGTGYISKDVLKDLWHDTTGETSEDHRSLGAWIEACNDEEKVGRYLSKYITKPEGTDTERTEATTGPKAGWEKPGRYWGIWHRAAMPWGEWTAADELSYGRAIKIQAKLAEAFGLSDLGFIPYQLTFYDDQPEEWAEDPEAKAEALG